MDTKKHFGRFYALIAMVAVSLAMLMAFGSPVQAVAASLPKYISEMILLTKDDEKAAKSAAEERGYTLMESPIYDTEDGKTYIAYKITTNPNKAIKQIKAMNMYGDWNYSEYKKYLEGQKAKVTVIMNGLKDAIAEYAEMYFNLPDENGEKRWADENNAHYAKKVLDYLRDDDMEMTIGDLFLLPVMTDKQALKDRKKAGEYLSETHLLEILMQSNADILAIMETALMMACSSYNNRSFLETLGSDIFTANSYKDEADKYRSAAQDILYTLADTQEKLNKYTKSPFAYTEDMLEMIDAQNEDIQEIIEEATEEAIEAAVNELIEQAKKAGEEYDVDELTEKVRKENMAEITEKVMEENDIEELTKSIREEYADEDLQFYMQKNKVSEEVARKAILTDEDYVAYHLWELENRRDEVFNADNDEAEQMRHDYNQGYVLYITLYKCKYRGYKDNNGNYEYENLYELLTKYDMTKLEPDAQGNYHYPYPVSDFYPVVGAMSKGERGLLKVGFTQLITSHNLTADELFEALKHIQKDLDDAVREFTEADLKVKAEEDVENGTANDASLEEATELELTTISIYANVDRSLFDADSDIAMTGLATREYKQNPEKSLMRDERVAAFDNVMKYVGIAAGGLVALEALTIFNMAVAIYSTMMTAIAEGSTIFYLGLEFEAKLGTCLVWAGKTFVYGLKGFGDCFAMLFDAASVLGEAMIEMVAITIGLILIALSVWLIVHFLMPEKDGVYTRIPRVLCSYEPLNEKDKNGDPVNDYVYYYGVKNPEIDPTSNDPSENVKKYQVQDICNWELEGDEREWIALYTTTDNGVGAPILADSLTVSSSSVLRDSDGKQLCTPVASFEEGTSEYGYNLMSAYNKTKKTDSNKIYLHYLTDKEGFARFGLTPTRTGVGAASVFANPELLAGCAISLLTGLGGGVAIMSIADKRKKNKANNA